MATIFLSYRRDDAADAAGRIYDRLTQQFGVGAVFMDVDSIPLGVDFAHHIVSRVQECLVMVVVIGPNWVGRSEKSHSLRIENTNDFVRIELELARSNGLAILPLLVSGGSLPNKKELPASLHWLPTRNAFQVRPNPDFHRDMDRVIAAVAVRLTYVEEQRRREAERQQFAGRESGDDSLDTSLATLPSQFLASLGIAPTLFRSVVESMEVAARAAPITFVAAGMFFAALTEVVAYFVTHTFPPTWLTHIIAGVIGVCVGGSSASTVSFEEIVRGIVSSAEIAVNELERLAGSARDSTRSHLADKPREKESEDGSEDTIVTMESGDKGVAKQYAVLSKAVLNSVRSGFLSALLPGIAPGVIVATLTEVVAYFVTHTLPPTWLTHIIAGVIGVCVGYWIVVLNANRVLFQAIGQALDLVVEAAKEQVESDYVE